MILVAAEHDTRTRNRLRTDSPARERAGSQQNEVGFLTMQTPKCERAFFECLRVRRDAGVGIGFRRGYREDLHIGNFSFCLFCTLYPWCLLCLFVVKCAVPETQVAFPRFEVASCL